MNQFKPLTLDDLCKIIPEGAKLWLDTEEYQYQEMKFIKCKLFFKDELGEVITFSTSLQFLDYLAEEYGLRYLETKGVISRQ